MIRRSSLALAVLASIVLTAPLVAQPAISIETLTNGVDADLPPGPSVLAGSAITWTYVVTNIGGRGLVNISVTDDQGVVVTCPQTSLPAGISMNCSANGVATLGQYANVGTVDAEQQDSTPVTASDPSHYFGESTSSVTIETSTNGFDADSPPGPSLAVGETAIWTYEVTNVGSEVLDPIDVTDDQSVAVGCPATSLSPGESMICTASSPVQPGQYANVGSVIAGLPDESQTAASDPSHYFGQTLLLETATNAQDADFPPGPTVAPGSVVAWTYRVVNPGPATVINLLVIDDQLGTITCPTSTLSAGELVVCSANGTAQPGQYANTATATAQLPAGGVVTASDPSHYFGNLLDLQKSTNGQDADLPPGPVVGVGTPVSWTYEVHNLSTDELTLVTVVDSQGVTVTCPGTTLAAGASMTCTANGSAIAGQYQNEGVVTAEHPGFGALSASDFSHYFGQNQILDFGDAADPSYQTALASDGARHVLGSAVYLGACVDSELDALPTAAADGDDLGAGTNTFGTCAVPGDDEDGVLFATSLVAGSVADVDVVANDDCTLSAWIDFNGDGDWTDAGEELFPGGVNLIAGPTSLMISVPAGALAGSTTARFRCTSDGPVSFTGEASDGEVEDYLVEVFATPAALEATKTASFVLDQNGNSSVDAGDVLAYTVLITNVGAAPAVGVVFTDTPDPNTSLSVGSVTTTAGTVVSGNAGGDATVQVDVGALAGGGNVTITFEVTANTPIPTGTTTISNQGQASADNTAAVPTDDPNLPGAADPTVVPAAATPASLLATKVVAFATDYDADGVADPGDVLAYTIVLANTSLVAALDIVFTDTPDPNTTLVSGTVTAGAGTVVLGNTAGDSAVRVDVASIAASGGSEVITFQVEVNDPLPAGVGQVSNQGLASGSNFEDALTDDPAAPGGSDPTVVGAEATSVLEIPTLGPASAFVLFLLLGAAGLSSLARRRVLAG